MESHGTKLATSILPEDVWSVIISNVNLYDTIFLRATSQWLYSACKKYRPFPKHHVLDQDKCMAYLIENCSTSCLEYVKYSLNFEWTEEQSTSAARSGNVDVLKYLCENGCPINATTALLECTKGTCDLNTIKYLHESGVSWEQNDLKKEYGVPPEGYYERDNTVQIVTENMAFHGHLECLKYAVENGCKDKRIWYTPSIECLDFVVANGFHWKGGLGSQQLQAPRAVKLSFCEQAAKLGDLTMLKYAYEKGAPLHKSDYIAACAGHLDCLEFCFEKVPGDKSDLLMDVKTIECFKFLYDKLGREFIEENCYDVWIAAAQGPIDCFQFLHARNIGLPEDSISQELILKASTWSLDTLKFAHEVLELSLTDDFHPFGDCTRNGNIEVLQYIKENMLSSWEEFDDDGETISSIVKDAILSMNVTVLRFIWEQYKEVVEANGYLPILWNEAVKNSTPEILEFMIEQEAQGSSKNLTVAPNLPNLAYLSRLGYQWVGNLVLEMSALCAKYAREHSQPQH